MSAKYAAQQLTDNPPLIWFKVKTPADCDVKIMQLYIHRAAKRDDSISVATTRFVNGELYASYFAATRE